MTTENGLEHAPIAAGSGRTITAVAPTALPLTITGEVNDVIQLAPLSREYWNPVRGSKF
jgi:hypothetical protein